MKDGTAAYLIFAVCALVAWYGAARFSFSGDFNERYWGLFLLVVFALGAITLPIVWSFQRWGRNRQDG